MIVNCYSEPSPWNKLKDGEFAPRSWVAICVDHWMAAQGGTDDEARGRLTSLLHAQNMIATKNGESVNRVENLGPAPQDVQLSYEKSDNKFQITI